MVPRLAFAKLTAQRAGRLAAALSTTGKVSSLLIRRWMFATSVALIAIAGCRSSSCGQRRALRLEKGPNGNRLAFSQRFHCLGSHDVPARFGCGATALLQYSLGRKITSF
jgi:hypothetical protein